MTPAPSLRPWEPEFIRLWQQGATQAEIAQALGIPQGTVKSRAHTLQQQGKIQARPRGGDDPSRQAEARPPGQTRERPPSTMDYNVVSQSTMICVVLDIVGMACHRIAYQLRGAVRNGETCAIRVP
jgi:hypothetical protein